MFTDNSGCVELLEKPPRCLFKLLAEQCHMPGGGDAAYLTNVHQEFASHPDYVKGEDRRNWDKEFGVRHYAGTVTYRVRGFVDKNRDAQQDVFFDFLEKSGKGYVAGLCRFKDLLSKVAQLGTELNRGDGSLSKGTARRVMTNKAKPTVSDAFRLQLQVLVEVLQSTNPWYVRCIKPNMTKAPDSYDQGLVLDQLKYLGMLEIIRIRKQGFPIHQPFAEFLQRYRCLSGKKKWLGDEKANVRGFLQGQGMASTEWQIGKTKVFLRGCVFEPLEEKRQKVLNASATLIQAVWKGQRQRKTYVRRREATLRIQRSYLSWRQRIRFIRMRRASVVIQAHLRGMFAREVAAALREAKRVEEERRRREALEEERRRREEEERRRQEAEAKGEGQSAMSEAGSEERLIVGDVEEEEAAEADMRERLRRKKSFAGLADMDESAAEQEMQKLSQLAGQLNPKLGAAEDQQVDLDQLFNFLSGEAPATDSSVRSESGRSGSGSEFTAASAGGNERSSAILDEIDRQMSDLQNEIDQYSLKEGVGGDEEGNGAPPPPPPPPPQHQARGSSPPPLPPPTAPASGMQLNKPSLPEPEGPPPPPPVQNGYAFNTPVLGQDVRNPLKKKRDKSKEPIYESIKPRPEPLGGNSEAPPGSNAELGQQQQQQQQQQPLNPISQNQQQQQQQPPQSPRRVQQQQQRGGRRRHRHNQNQTAAPVAPPVVPPDPEKEARRQQRVKRGLERIQEQQQQQLDENKENGEESQPQQEPDFDLVEFAENFFNDHERSPQGTVIMGTLKRSKTMELLPKSEMVSYYKGSSIPNSHVHMYDPENASLAVAIFRELCRFSRGECKTPEQEVQVVQVRGTVS